VKVNVVVNSVKANGVRSFAKANDVQSGVDVNVIRAVSAEYDGKRDVRNSAKANVAKENSVKANDVRSFAKANDVQSGVDVNVIRAATSETNVKMIGAKRIAIAIAKVTIDALKRIAIVTGDLDDLQSVPTRCRSV